MVHLVMVTHGLSQNIARVMVVQVATPVYNPFGDGLSQCDGHTWVNPLDDGLA